MNKKRILRILEPWIKKGVVIFAVNRISLSIFAAIPYDIEGGTRFVQEEMEKELFKTTGREVSITYADMHEFEDPNFHPEPEELALYELYREIRLRNTGG